MIILRIFCLSGSKCELDFDFIVKDKIEWLTDQIKIVDSTASGRAKTGAALHDKPLVVFCFDLNLIGPIHDVI